MRKSRAENVLDRELNSFGRKMSILAFEQMFVTGQFKEAQDQFADYIAKAKSHADSNVRNLILKKAIMGSATTGTDVTKNSIIRFPLGGKYIKVREKKRAGRRQEA